jgi:hypothetical protein
MDFIKQIVCVHACGRTHTHTFNMYKGRLKSNAHMLVERERNDLQKYISVCSFVEPLRLRINTTACIALVMQWLREWRIYNNRFWETARWTCSRGNGEIGCCLRGPRHGGYKEDNWGNQVNWALQGKLRRNFAKFQLIVGSQLCVGLEHGSSGIAFVNIGYQETCSDNIAED